MSEQSSFVIETEPQRPVRRGLSVGSIVLLTGILLMVLVVGVQLARQNMTQPTSGPAPDFTLQTYDGQTIRLSEQRGKVIVINFWGSWCEPCHEEAPILQNLWERYQNRGVLFLGIAYLDVERESQAFIAQYGITYPNGLDLGNRISDLYRITGAPETFVIDQQGNLAPVFDNRSNLIPFYPGPFSPRGGYDPEALARTLDALLGA